MVSRAEDPAGLGRGYQQSRTHRVPWSQLKFEAVFSLKRAGIELNKNY
jgi:hypothetical protein